MGLFDDFDDAFEFVAESSFSLIGILVRCYLFAICVTTVIFVPYFAALYLNRFTGTIVANNLIFFLLIFALLAFLKFFSFKTSNNFLVRTLFKAFTVTGIVSVFLFVLNFDSVIYSITGAIAHYFSGEENVFVELSQNTRYFEVVENHWFYNTLVSFIDKIIEFAKWSFGNVLALDNSCFSASAETLDIFKIIYTIFAYIILGGFSVLGTTLFAILLSAGVAVGVYIPYSVGFGLTNLCNKLIYKYRFQKSYQSFISKHIIRRFFPKKKRV